MLNTGYVDQFAFIKDAEINDIRQMYKHMLHPELGADVVFIGWARPGVGGVPACSEMQSRYFSLLCSHVLQLPEKTELESLIQQQENFEEKIYHKNPALRTLVHYSTFMHDFAKTIGCSPWQSATF
jgi:dimethylaniline monooxygenase (N-oxide forming)